MFGTVIAFTSFTSSLGDNIMNRSKVLATAMTLGMALLIGTSGSAFAYPGNYGCGGQIMTQEQQAGAQEVFSEYNRQTAPLRQQQAAKRAELDSLYYGQNVDSGKVQTLYREIADIESKLFAANAELRKKLADRGIPSSGYGARHGCGMFGGNGGRGMHGYGHW
jgi:hypothetical protein